MLKQGLPYIITLLIIVLLFSLFGYLLLKNNNETNKMLKEKESTLQQIYSAGNLPSDELISAMEKDNIVLADKYKKIRESLPVAKESSIPEGVNLSLFFMEELKNTKERIGTKAKEKGIEITTEGLGLDNSLPTDQGAPQLIKNLYLTEMIVNLLIDTGVSSIDSIGLGEITKTDMYEEIPLILSVKCDILSLAKLLFTLENTDQGFFIVKNFSLSSIIEGKEMTGISDASMDPRAGRFQDQTRSETLGTVKTGSVGGKKIQVQLRLSVIRWGKS